MITPGQTPITEQAFGAAAHWLPQMLLVAGIVVLAFFITMTIRAKIRRRQAAVLPARERIEQIKAAREDRDDIKAAESHALDFTQRLTSQLDAKAAKLEHLIREADQRIADLARLADGDNAGHGARPAAAPPRSVGPSTKAAHFARPPKEEVDAVTQSIYELADAGCDSLEIARQLDEQVGKIELILALRQV